MKYENGAFYVCRSILSFCFQFVLLVEQVGVSACPREWDNLDVGSHRGQSRNLISIVLLKIRMPIRTCAPVLEASFGL